ncbi:MAG: UvrD-helicase domain-containing protein [Anaerolineaceae bacterium]|nr:UvrD-helicase domain-containing protein [Anaerolineaceae bacterium]
MTLQLTAEQRRAIYTHDRNLVVLAAAGSGKTHVLVERMLALLDANPDWPLESLVAITFTRKAAREMRERLRDKLRERSQSAEQEDRDRWQGHLAAVDSAIIGTIHSLCTRVLRACAAEARLDPEFRVMEAEESGVALDEALEEALQHLAEAEDPSLALFAEYDRKQIMEALRAQLPESVPDPVPDDLLQRWQVEWERDAEERLKAFRASSDFQDALTWEPRHGWPQDDKLGDVWAVCRPLCIEFENAAIAQSPELLQAIDDAIKLTGGTQKNWGDKETVEEARAGLRTLREEGRRVLKDIGEGITDLDRRAAELLPLWRRLIVEAREVYVARKRADNFLDFNELEQLAQEVLRQPLVRERFRSEFNQVLVDEFHDTSPLQWQIIRALADPQEPGRLFIVGDPRQSIYGFRGADVDNFSKALDEVRAGGGLQVSLSQSFRSHQPLLDVLNEIHCVALPKDRHEPMVSERRQAPGAQAALELLLMDYRAAELGAEEGRERLARALARRLKGLAAEGCPTLDRESGEIRPLGYGDVALLFRTHNRMPEFEEAFRELELPYVTLGGRGFFGRQEVLDLLNLLRALRNTSDDLSLASVLRSPLFALSDEALLRLRMPVNSDGERAPLWDALQRPADLTGPDARQARFAAECLREFALLAGRVTVADLLREALARTGYLATLGGLYDGARRRGNVEKLLDKAAARAWLFTEFETLLRELSQREVREGDVAAGSEGAITLMTVHNSKGLEFPLVVLADAGKWRAPGDTGVLRREGDGNLVCKVFDMAQGSHRAPYAWRRIEAQGRQESLDERRRLLYVASTRAQDYLIVCANHDGKPGDEGWLAWLHEALQPERHSADATWRVGRGKVVWRDLSGSILETGPVADGPTGTHDKPELSLSEGAAPALPLLRPLPEKAPGLLYEINVTQLSEHFERSFLRGTGSGSLPGDPEEQRILGDVMHDALRWWRPDSEPDAAQLQRRLEGLIWARGVRDSRRRTRLQREAAALLESFEDSALAGRMRRAPRLLRELPFMQRHGGCLIQGSIDLLMLDVDGGWTLVDFKSANPGEGAEPAAAEEHARRYRLQLGLYARALVERPDIDPESLTVQVHYLRHGLDVVVPSTAWRQALEELDGIVAVESANAVGD